MRDDIKFILIALFFILCALIIVAMLRDQFGDWGNFRLMMGDIPKVTP